MILTKITTLEFSVAKRACKANPELKLTSEFNEVYFSERRNFEATHKIPTSKNKFGWRNLQGFGTVKFLLYSP